MQRLTVQLKSVFILKKNISADENVFATVLNNFDQPTPPSLLKINMASPSGLIR